MRPPIQVLPLLLLLASCSSTTESEWHREIGVVETGRIDVSPLQAPQAVSAGVAFQVVVTTFGSSSCTRPDGASVRTGGAAAEITPYDLRLRGQVACTQDEAMFPREVMVRLGAPGQAVVRVRGRNFRGEETSVEQTVTVQP